MLRRLLDRPIAVTMVMVVVVILGVVSSRLLPVSLVPDVDAPYITVQLSSPGTSARELEETAVRPLRSQLVQLARLTDIRSESREGNGVIYLTFEPGSRLKYLFIEVNEKIDRAVSGLPKEMERPKAVKASATDIPAFYINLTVRDEKRYEPTDLYPVSSRFSELSVFAQQVIAKRIEQLPEVAMVDLSGLAQPELLVLPDEAKLQQAGLTVQTLEQALARSNVRLGSLTIRDGEYQFNVKFQSEVASREEIEQVYLNIEGRVFQLKDLAEVIEHPAKMQGHILSDGSHAVSLAVIKQADARMASLKAGIEELMRSFRSDYPDVRFTLTRDQTELLDYSISNLVNNIIAGALLACIIIFFFMRDWKSPLLVVFTIPTALILSVLVFYLAGLSINIISLSGLVLGVGMMVDNSIIVIDNITARWDRGEALREAVVRGTTEVLTPMLSSILTTCAVFIPLIFISGIAGAMFFDQAIAVTTTLFAAYVVTITLIPVYYYWWYRRQPHFVPSRFLARFAFDGVIRRYDRVLEWLFCHRPVMWGIYLLSIAGVAVMFAVIEKEKLPQMTYDDMLVRIDWNERISADENARRTEEILSGLPGIEQRTVMAGVQQFILAQEEQSAISEATVYLRCTDAKQVEPLQRKLTRRFAERYPDALCSFSASGNIFDLIFADREATLTARLRSTTKEPPSPETLRPLLARIARALPDQELPPVPVQENVLYVARPELMALYGVTFSELQSVLRNALNENRLFSIVSGEESLPVVVGTDVKEIGDILTSSFVRKAGVELPVGIFMLQTREADLKSIVSGVEGTYYPLDLEVAARDVPQTMRTIRETVLAEPGFEVDFSGSYFSNRAMIGELVMVLVIALLLLYFILAAQFESLVQPFIILSEIVIDLFGALVVLWAFGVTLNLMSMIGLIVVCGIVINDSILKVDTINTLRRQGMGLRRAIIEAGQRRLKAIIMTSLTTILAVAPFLARGSMGADLQYPMSMVIIGGMIIGTLVSVFFIPLAYYEIYKPRKSTRR